MMHLLAQTRTRRVALGSTLLLLLLSTLGFWGTYSANAGTTTGPDVTVIRIGDVANNGSSGSTQAYSVGTTSCNVGNQPVWWCNDSGDTFCNTNQHPVIAQNMYRLKGGRFEQIGMSWLKHGFVSTNSFESACGSCVSPPHGGDQLGVGCTDTYSSGLNGSRPLGMRSEVNATNGDFRYPYTTVSSSTVIDQRVQVARSELDPAANPGARYWVEGHYIAADDAGVGNAFNNASYREVTVSAGTYNLSFVGSTVREMPAISVWQVIDPTVRIVNADVPGPIVERFHVARKVTEIVGGFHYEYAVHNMNSDRAARRFVVQFPNPTVITNVGFRDVNHHSGEPFATTDWTVDLVGLPNAVQWLTDTFDVDSNANALRWGTMFSFWFDADQPSAGSTHTIGLFKPGTPTDVTFSLEQTIFTDGFESGDIDAWSCSTSGGSPCMSTLRGLEQ